MRAAAAITSITMKGGTSLRTEGAINRFAASNICRALPHNPLMRHIIPAPLSPHFCGLSDGAKSRNQT